MAGNGHLSFLLYFSRAIISIASSATMGMRFMQRKSLNGNNNKNNDKQHSQNKQIDTSTAASTGNNTKTNQNHMITTNNTATSSGIKRDLSNLTSNTEETSILIQSASTTDIYGPHSDIIGRRSYNNFRKCIANTWETAYTKRENNLQNTNKSNGKISDEELLKRYQCYVNQRGGKREDDVVSGESRRKRKTVSS
eukprot:scaffold48279_cov50-Cyclotella_meneghiniana.AAC.2